MKLKPLKFRKNFNCDVLIFDDIGMTWLTETVPESHSIGYLSTRFSYPILISKFFFVQLLNLLIKFLSGRGNNSYTYYIESLILSIKPRIVLTGADNSHILAKIAEQTSHIQFLFIQTSIRDRHSFKEKLKLPIYCSFGHVEKDIFDHLTVGYDGYLPIGSIKLGLAIASMKSRALPSTNLCFISSYRPEVLYENKRHIEQRIQDIDEILFLHSLKYAQNSNLRISIVGKARESLWQEKEQSYYANLAQGLQFEYVKTDKTSNQYSSYYAVLNSSVCITCGSTLGFEALSANKKILFGATLDLDFLDKWGVSDYFNILPEFICLQNSSFDLFRSQLDNIREMSIQQYQALTEYASSQIIHKHNSLQPHEIVRDRIQCYLENH